MLPTLPDISKSDRPSDVHEAGLAKGIAAALDSLRQIEPGVVPCAVLNLAANPTAADTIGIGGDTYELVAPGGQVSTAGNIAVERGADAATSRASLVAAINAAATADNQHPSITTDGTTPAKSNGTESVRATVVGTTVRVQAADAPGGTKAGANPDILLAEGLTDAGDIWLCGNVNLNTLGGRAAGQQPAGMTRVKVTAAMVTGGAHRLCFPFDVAGFAVLQVTAASNKLVVREGGDDTWAIDNGDVLLTLTGGVAPDLQANDEVAIVAWG